MERAIKMESSSCSGFLDFHQGKVVPRAKRGFRRHGLAVDETCGLAVLELGGIHAREMSLDGGVIMKVGKS